MGKFKYKVGDRIGPYDIEFLGYTKKDGAKWKGNFICPYDNTVFECSVNSIARGNTRSCGCYRKNVTMPKLHESNAVDLAGKKSGTWTFLKRSNRQSKNLTWYWDCVCENGHTKQILSSNFGRTLTCDKCKNKSLGERQVEKILIELEIKFQEQFYFKDCLSPKQSYLYFDFYLPDYNCCIEYDGIQHFEKTNWSHDDFEDRQKRDNIKNQYCKENNIKLIRIPYWDYDKIDKSYLMERING